MGPETSIPIAGLDNIPVPTCPEQAAETLQKLAASSRRSFIGRGMAAATVPGVILAASSTSLADHNNGRNGNNGNSGNNGNTGNNNGRGNTVLPTYFPAQTRALFQEIQADEASHVNIIITAIRSLGGQPRPLPTFQGIDISDPQAFLNLSVVLENTGVHAYFGAAPHISNVNVLGVAASIAFVEAYHSGWLNTLAHLPLIPGGLTYVTPLSQEAIVMAAKPFIANLNDPMNQFPVGFSTANGPTNPSVANDIAILNFALLLEYLEAVFYFNSVKKVFAR